MNERGRLLWQCRRGMLELDLALQAFVEDGFDALDAEHRAHFIALLDAPDDLLWGYLFGGVIPHDEMTVELIERIRVSAGP